MTPADGVGDSAALGAFIRGHRRDERLSLRKLADRAGVSNPYLSQIERGLRRPSADILHRLADALSIAPESLYVLAGILDDRPSRAGVIAEIERDPHLRAEHRARLLALYAECRADAGVPLAADGPYGEGPDGDGPGGDGSDGEGPESSRGPQR